MNGQFNEKANVELYKAEDLALDYDSCQPSDWSAYGLAVLLAASSLMR